MPWCWMLLIRARVKKSWYCKRLIPHAGHFKKGPKMLDALVAKSIAGLVPVRKSAKSGMTGVWKAFDMCNAMRLDALNSDRVQGVLVMQVPHSACRCSVKFLRNKCLVEEGPHVGSSESHVKRWRWGSQVSISHPQDWFSNHGSSDGSSGTAIMWFHCGLKLDTFHATANGSYHSFHSSIRFLRQVQWHRLYKCKCLIKVGSCKDTSIYCILLHQCPVHSQASHLVVSFWRPKWHSAIKCLAAVFTA